MCWENYNIVWHIDHIFPLSKINWSDQEQIAMVCHYTNLQPMYIKDNIIKSNKLIH